MLAAFTDDGKLSKEYKFATNPDYRRFLDDLAAALEANFADFEFDYACCAFPGMVDRKHGIALRAGNLSWHYEPLKNDLQKILNQIPVIIENDAKLGGLSEALLVHEKYKKVLYLTISTGIGGGIIINGKIDPVLADMEPGRMLLEHDGKLKKWEDFASGRALHEKYGKLASEINDRAVWKSFAADIALGLEELLAIIQPEVVIIGGGVGAHYEKFGEFLGEALKKNESDMVKVPPIIKASRPEEAVIYGCYDFIKSSS